MNTPAILGGTPVFTSKVSMVRPVLPRFDDLAGDIGQILATGMVTKGSCLAAFEKAVAGHLGVKHAIGVSSCTSGLMLVCRAAGLSGDVVVPSFTFMATVAALVWAGLRPVFADVNEATTNVDPDAVERAITPETSAIFAVHNFGNPAAIGRLEQIARRRGLALVFDAAHGFGARYRSRPVGGQGDAHVFSLSPTKLLIAGEGGVVATNDDEIAANVRLGREYGNDGHYDTVFPGLNARLAEFNALLGLRSLDQLEAAATRRNEVAAAFRARLRDIAGIGFQAVDAADRCSFKDFSITIDPDGFRMTRDQLAIALAVENVDVRKYYDPPAHRQTAYRRYAPPNGALRATDRLAVRSLSLPMWSRMDEAVAEGVCAAIRRIHRNAAAVVAAVDRTNRAPEPNAASRRPRHRPAVVVASA
jgi:dTDP-4-amino-4,6-dideoxygalactose transaminase